MADDRRVTDELLTDLREDIEFWGNNCGGCETCGQIFGSKTQPDFDLQTLHCIIVELQERRAKDPKQSEASLTLQLAADKPSEPNTNTPA